MQTTLFILAWAVAFFGVIAFAFYSTRGRRDHGQSDHGQSDHGQSDHGQSDHGQSDHGQGGRQHPLGSVPAGVRVLIGLTAALALVAIPALVSASASDRVPSGAGTYTLDSTESQREGRTIFSETCASCHTLTAANARGVYGPNLDTIGLDAEGSATRIQTAIKNGGAAGTQMPKDLLEGEDAKLVSDYVAAVAGK